MSFIRYPDGIFNTFFYSKNKPTWTPEWISSQKIGEGEDVIDYVLLQEKASLIWSANLAALELHPMNVSVPHITKPDQIIFDLDPSKLITFEQLKELALGLRYFLMENGLNPFIKTSGSKGLHIYCPIIPELHQDEVFEFIHKISKVFIEKNKKIATLRITKEKREGKVLLDIYRNRKSQTCVAPFSFRAKELAPISMPFHWDHLDSVEHSQQWNIKNYQDYLNEHGNAWKNYHASATSINKGPKTVQENTDDLTLYKSPMLASMGSKIPIKKDEYFYEVKWDGIRAIFILKNKELTIYSRSGNDITEKFPELHYMKEIIQADSVVLDGEIIALSKEGKPHFSNIVGRIHKQGNAIENAAKSAPATTYIFDMLYKNGQDYRSLSNQHRRAILKNTISFDQRVKFSDAFEDGQMLFSAIEKQGLEGIICKKKTGKYVNGGRSNDWIKVKCKKEDTAYIVGYTKGEGDRGPYFGALHLAKKKEKEWIYMGKIGTGFTMESLRKVYNILEKVDRSEKLFEESIEKEYDSTWITPIYQCELVFASFSSNGTYREPVFIKLIPED